MSIRLTRRAVRNGLRLKPTSVRCNARAYRRLIWLCTFAASALLASCQNVSTDEYLSGAAIKSPLRLSPANATVIESQTLQFTVTGGYPPYSFKLFSGGGSVSGSVYTAPSAIGSAVVTVSDTAGTSLASLITIVSNANCPTNFIPVPFNNSVGTTANFCVSKYEMKCNGACSGAPISAAAGLPWVSITQADAKTACALLGGQYHLITNAEWMTIARSIEATAANWSTGTVNSGAINRGHSDGTPASPLAASTDDDACSGTGQNCTVFNDQRRTHVLANGQTIWDFSGNAKEFIDWQLSTDRAGSGAGGYVELNTQTVTTSMPANTFKSNTTALNSANGIGMYLPDTNNQNGYAARGGHNANNSQAGIYHLDFGQNASFTSSQFGFRCVYQ
jgi:hypothetical protein